MINYDTYLNRPNSPIPVLHQQLLEKGADLPLKEVLKFENLNSLLDEYPANTKNGFYHFKDGSAYVAVQTVMPKVGIDMIDWWFWWHAKEGIRYRIWYPEMHFDIVSDFGGCYDDASKSYRERLHGSTHMVTEDIGTGKEKLAIDFMSPEAFGFDQSKLGPPEEQTIICAQVGTLDKRVWFTKMCHAVQKAEQGVIMHSRFWIGAEIRRMDKFGQTILNTILNQSFIKRNLIPKGVAKHLFHHCTQEYHNLADILPELYKQLH